MTASLALLLLAGTLTATGVAAAASESADGQATWSKLAAPPAPDARIEHSMVYAPEFDLVILFGGLTSHGRDADLWMIRPDDPKPTWFSPVIPGPAPGPRAAASAVWDSDRHRLILFGGIADQPDGARDGYNDVWALDFDSQGTPTGWVELYGGEGSTDVYGATAPLERWGAAAVYDSERQRLIIQGGSNRASNAVDSVPKRCVQEALCLPKTPAHPIVEPWGFPDMWSFDLAGSDGWELLDADGPKQTFVYAVYDAEYDRMVTFKNYGPYTKKEAPTPPPPDVRSVDLATNTWTDWPDPALDIRPGLSSAWGYDEATRSVVAAGYDWNPYPKLTLSTYTLHLDQPGSETMWERLPGSPNALALGGGEAAGVVVPGEHGESRFVAFGGSTGSKNGSLVGPVDLQAYGLGTGVWTSVSGAPLLHARSKHATILDEQRRQLYVIGGTLTGTHAETDDIVWRLDLDDGRWEGLRPPGDGPPEPISGGTSTMAVYDPVGDRILQLPNCGEDVFALDLETTTWSRLATEGEQPHLCGANLVYDSKRERILALNGYTINGPMWCVVELDCLTRSPHPEDSEPNRVAYSLDLAGETPTWRALRSQGVSRGAADRGTSAVYDSVADRVLLLTFDAGQYQEPAGNAIVESLSFADGDQGTWSVVGTSDGLASAPAPRAGSQAVFDEANGQMVIWGGATEFSKNPADPTVYSFRPPTETSGAEWGVIPTSGVTPTGRVYGSAAYDRQMGRMITFGGLSSSLEGASRDAYTLTLSSPPASSEEATAAPDSPPLPESLGQAAMWSAAGPYGVCTPGIPTIDDRCEDGRFAFDLDADADLPMAQAPSPNGDRLYVAGASWSLLSNSYDIVTVAFDPGAPPGEMRSWVARYDGGSYLDVPYGIAVSPDGGKIFVTGTSRSFGTDYDFVTIAYERQTGRELWVATHDGSGLPDEGSLDVPDEVNVSPDGSQVYVAGTTKAPNGASADWDYTTVAYDAGTGKRSWTSTYAGQPTGNNQPSNDIVTDAVLSPDGDTLYVSGTTADGPDYLFGTVAIETASGQTKWVSRMGAGGVNLPRSVGVSPDGERVFITGAARRPGRLTDYDLLTTAIETGDGQEVWTKRYAGAAPVWNGAGFNQGRSLAVAPSGDRVYVTGAVAGDVQYGTPKEGLASATIAYSTGTGQRLWDSRYSASENDTPAAIATSPDGAKVYVTGSSLTQTNGDAPITEDMATIAYDSSTGAQSWAARYDGTGVSDTPLDFERAVGISVVNWGGQTVIYSLAKRSGSTNLPASSDYVVAIYREGD